MTCARALDGTCCIRSGPARALSFFFFNDTATTEIYTLSLHDALPISPSRRQFHSCFVQYPALSPRACETKSFFHATRSEEHTSELQSRLHLVCRLLLEKKKRARAEELPADGQDDEPESVFSLHLYTGV